MPDPIVCPHCREELDIPAEYHGRPVRCANCQNVFTAAAADSTPVVHRSRGRDEPNGDRPPWRDDHAPQPSRRPRPDADEDDRPPRRSNVGVIGFLLLTALTVGGCCGGMNVFMAAQVNPTFIPHTSAEGKFKVEFPAETPISGPTTNPADPTIEGVQASSRRDYGQEVYTVKSYDLKADWRKLPPEEALKKVVAAELEVLVLNPAQRVEQRSENTSHQGFVARDVIAGDGNGLSGRDTLMRCVLAGRRVYVVVYQAQMVHVQYWWVRKYFLSFEITDPTAKPPKEEPKKE